MMRFTSVMSPASPIGQAALGVLQTTGSSQQSALEILVLFGDELLTDDVTGPLCTNRVLIWSVQPDRVIVGPLLDESSGACASCLSYWTLHNKPDRELWAKIPQAPKGVVPTLSWPPSVFKALELMSVEFVLQGSKREVLEITTATLSVDRHCYLKAPFCLRCNPPQDDSLQYVQAPTQQIWKKAPKQFRSMPIPTASLLRRAYVDFRIGLVQHLYRDEQSDILPMWGAVSRITSSETPEIGYGRHESQKVAESVSILEVLERFSGTAARARRVAVHDSYEGLRRAGQPVMDPRQFILPYAAQSTEPNYYSKQYSGTMAMHWRWGFSWSLKGPVLIPEQLCYYGAVIPEEERFVFETSNGCALGGTLEEATFHGLLEIIERDAYMTRWYLRARPCRLDLNDPSMPDVRRIAARAHAEGFEVYAFKIDIDIPVPAVLAFILDPNQDAPVATYCASGAHPVAAVAIMSALVEVCSSMGVYQATLGSERTRARALLEDASKVQSMRDHILLYSLPESLDRLAFLDRSSTPITAAQAFADAEPRWASDNLTAELWHLLDLVCNVAADVVIIDQTSSLLDPLQLHCTKVLAPGLHPITFGHQNRRISHLRLELAKREFIKRGEKYEPSINPFPHNFP